MTEQLHCMIINVAAGLHQVAWAHVQLYSSSQSMTGETG